MTTGSWIQKLYTSRDRNTPKFDQEFGNLGTTFVGEVGRLWYNPDTNCLYVSDGVTPGGIPLNTCGNVLGVANIAVYDEGNLIANRTASFDFVGAGVTATAVGNAITITIPGVDTSYPLTIQDIGNTLTTAANLINFTGAGITVTNIGNLITVDVPAVASYPLTVEDEGVILSDSANVINFTGEGVTATNIGGNVTVSIPGYTALTVEDEGSTLVTTADLLNFVGDGVTANASGNSVTITIPGVDTSYPLTVQDEGNTLTTAANVMNFTGEGVTANVAGNVVTVDVGPGIAFLYSGSFIFDTATTLTAGINSNTTAPIPVGSTTGFYDSGYIRIGTELIQYTGKTATTFTGITRGVAGSNGSTHNSGAGVSQAQVTAAGVPVQVFLDVTDISNNVTLDPATGNVTIGGSGTYNLMFSVQIENFSNAPADTAIWFRVNGNDIPISASYATTDAVHGGVPGATVVAVNFFYTLAAGDVVALMWTSLNGQTAITSIPPVVGSIPQSPGVIFTVNRLY